MLLSSCACTGLSSNRACSSGSQCSTASVGARRSASPLPLSGFVAGGLRPAQVASPAPLCSAVPAGEEGDVQTRSLGRDPANQLAVHCSPGNAARRHHPCLACVAGSTVDVVLLPVGPLFNFGFKGN